MSKMTPSFPKETKEEKLITCSTKLLINLLHVAMQLIIYKLAQH